MNRQWRWLLTGALGVTAIDMATEAILIVGPGGAYWTSIAITLVMNIGAIVLLWTRPDWGRWAAMSAFGFDFLMFSYMWIDFMFSGYAGTWSALVELRPVLSGALFLWAAWVYQPEEARHV